VVTNKNAIITTTDNVNNNTTSQRGIKGIFIGFTLNQQGWLIYLPGSCHITVSNGVAFDENLESALSYNDKPFSDSLPLLPLHTPKPQKDTVIEHTGDDTNAYSSLKEATTMIINSQHTQHKNDTGEIVHAINEDMDEDAIPNHDHASYQEE
jgi:hypothetical protein